MANNKGWSVGRALALVFLVMITIASIGAMIGLEELTMVSILIPIGVSLFVGAVIGLVAWRWWSKLTGIPSFPLNYICNLVFVTLFLTGTFYTINILFLREEPPRKVQAHLERKYRETRHTTRRVGRRSYVKGPDYQVYIIEVSLPDGKKKDIQLPWKVYDNLSSDSDITLSFRQGFFGVDVLITNDIPYDNPVRKKKGKGRCKFFGTSGK